MAPIEDPVTPAPSDPPSDMKRFGRYTLVSKLGHGGMAQVYLALTKGMGDFRKIVVLKILHSHLEDDPAFVDMFMDEARLAARLSHPHVVSTLEVGEFRGAHFMAMQYLEGQPLDQVIDRVYKSAGGFDLATAVTILSQSLQGLHYAHELRDYDGTPLGVVHRDVSPHNIFVTYQGLAKVLDFGIAKAATKVTHTRTGVIRGKYAYMAPEQAEGRNVDARADVWSAGVVAWEVLTGKRLFRRENEMATLHAVTQLEIPNVHQVNSSVPESIGDVVTRALSRDPVGRFESAEAFRKALCNAAASHGVQPASEIVGAALRENFAAEEKQGRDLVRRAMKSELSDDLPEFRRDWTPSPLGATPVTATAAGPSTTVRPVQDGPARRGLPWFGAGLVLAVTLVIAGLVFGWIPGLPQEEQRPNEPHSVAGEAPQLNDDSASSRANAENEGQDTAEDGAGSPERAVANESQSETGTQEADTAGADEREQSAAENRTSDRLRERAADRRRRRNRNRNRGERRSERVQRADPASTMTDTHSAAVETGRLSFDTTPWTNVSLRGRALGQTPLLGIEVPAGTHVLRLSNPELGISRTYTVTVRPGEATRLRIAVN